MIEYDRFSHLFTHIWPYLPLSRGIVQEGEERIYSFTCQLLPSQAPKSTATGGAPWPPSSPCPASIWTPGPVPPPDFITTYVFNALASSRSQTYIPM